MLRDLHLYFPLFLVILGFAAVFIAGIFVIRLNKRKTAKKLGGLLMTVGGFMTALLTFLVFWLPTPTEYAIMEMSLFYSKPTLFKSIYLKSNSEHTTELFDLEEFKIESRNEIDAVVEALHTARSFAPSHPVARWSLRLVLNTRKTHMSMDVDYCGDPRSENGTILYVHNSMGTYRCDCMGAILEEILLRKAKPIFRLSRLTDSPFPGQHLRL